MSDVQEIVAMVCRIGNLTQLGPDDILYEAGFTSMGALQLLPAD